MGPLHESVYKHNLNQLQSLVENKSNFAHLKGGDRSVLKTQSLVERINPFSVKQSPEPAIQQTFEKGMFRIKKGDADPKELEKLKSTARFVYQLKFDGKVSQKTADVAYKLFSKADKILKKSHGTGEDSMRESLTRKQLGMTRSKSESSLTSPSPQGLSSSKSTLSIPDLLSSPEVSSSREDVRRVRFQRFEAMQQEERYRKIRETIRAKSPDTPLRPSPDEVLPRTRRTLEAKPVPHTENEPILKEKWPRVWARINWLRAGGNYSVQVRTKEGIKTVPAKETLYYEAETDRRVLKLMAKLASSGDPRAEYELGIYYMSVGDSMKNENESFTEMGINLLKRAAKKNYGPASTVLQNLGVTETSQS